MYVTRLSLLSHQKMSPGKTFNFPSLAAAASCHIARQAGTLAEQPGSSSSSLHRGQTGIVNNNWICIQDPDDNIAEALVLPWRCCEVTWW